jgi:uncharacterized protein GlcG (DUF336 family)
MSSKSLVLALVATAVAAGSAYADPAGPITPISARLAAKAVLAALTTCAEEGYRVTVTIVDREGVTRAQLVGDGAGPISITTSRRKAYTSAALGVNTVAYGKLVSKYTGPPIDPELVTFAGGLPIVSHGAVIGGIGVGGAYREEQDEACAQAGLDAVKDLLN